MNEGKGRRKRRSAFVAARKQIRRGEAEEGGKERERVDKGAAGNKRLANPSCQFNLASNPGEMLIRASLPFLPSLPPRRSLPARSFRFSFPRARERERERASRQRHFIFAQRYRRGGRRPRGNCVQSELHPSFFFLEPRSSSFALVLSFFLSLSPAPPLPSPTTFPFGLPPS